MKKKSKRDRFSVKRLFLTGFFMGTADLIPGVSGGTIAFISGIYNDLLSSIKTVTNDTVKTALTLDIQKTIRTIPFHFLLPVFMGMLTAILLLARFLSFLLETYPVFIWSFFFGLVIASTWIVLKGIKSWKHSLFLFFVCFMVVGYFVVGVIPVETPTTIPFYFLSGMLAICAMILPGISGSFIILILGKYAQVLSAVKNFEFLTILVIMIGAVVGLALFSKLLSWLFSHKHDETIASLAGFMLGSARKLWPWKEVVTTRINSHGEVVPLVEKNVFPAFTSSLFVPFAMALLGVIVIIILGRIQQTKGEDESGELSQ